MPLDFAHETYFLDLFSGIGGFALGAQWAGLRFDAHYFSEVDDYAIRVYQQRFPDAIGLGSICNIKGGGLPRGKWIVAGGFPCQDISVAGKGAGLAGKRSGLWYEYARLIGELRPRYAIMENVGALTFRGLDAVLGSLAEIGYDAEWQDIRASDVGAPHRRERIWIVAYPGSEQHESTSNEVGRTTTSGLFEDDVADSDGARWKGQCKPIGNTETLSRSWSSGANVAYADEGGRRANFSSISWQSQPDPTRGGEARSVSGRWLPESGFRRVAHGVPARVDRLKCLGNSIVPQVSELIFSQPSFDEWRQDA
jgi:DNA (cytosine-5)-methyltransferase 1